MSIQETEKFRGEVMIVGSGNQLTRTSMLGVVYPNTSRVHFEPLETVRLLEIRLNAVLQLYVSKSLGYPRTLLDWNERPLRLGCEEINYSNPQFWRLECMNDCGSSILETLINPSVPGAPLRNDY